MHTCCPSSLALGALRRQKILEKNKEHGPTLTGKPLALPDYGDKEDVGGESHCLLLTSCGFGLGAPPKELY